MPRRHETREATLERLRTTLRMSAQQRRAFEMVVAEGKSLFLTGGGGVGKSQTLQNIIYALRELKKNLRVTASTGIAALNIHGVTLHSQGKIGIAINLPDAYTAMRASRAFEKAWKKVEVLLVDEISMVSPQYLYCLEDCVRRFKGNTAPWGGIQVVFSGDFFQLPPVPERGAAGPHALPAWEFCFELPNWHAMVPHVVELTEVFRQQDQPFIELLQRARFGRITAADHAWLHTRVMSERDAMLPDEQGIAPTVLTSHKQDVHRTNQHFLGLLDGPEHRYEAHIGSSTRTREDNADDEDANAPSDEELSRGTPAQISVAQQRKLQQMQDLLTKAEPAETTLRLKERAQVILTCNLAQEEGLVNGSRGVVLGFAASLVDWERAQAAEAAAETSATPHTKSEPQKDRSKDPQHRSPAVKSEAADAAGPEAKPEADPAVRPEARPEAKAAKPVKQERPPQIHVKAELKREVQAEGEAQGMRAVKQEAADVICVRVDREGSGISRAVKREHGEAFGQAFGQSVAYSVPAETVARAVARARDPPSVARAPSAADVQRRKIDEMLALLSAPLQLPAAPAERGYAQRGRGRGRGGGGTGAAPPVRDRGHAVCAAPPRAPTPMPQWAVAAGLAVSPAGATGGAASDATAWPVVRFANGTLRCLEPYYWRKTKRGVGEAFFAQVPLRLGWAVTIHKAQGMSLDRVAARLDRTVFATGQAYVALSRCRSFEGLRIMGLDPAVITAHPKVARFYNAGCRWAADGQPAGPSAAALVAARPDRYALPYGRAADDVLFNDAAAAEDAAMFF